MQLAELRHHAVAELEQRPSGRDGTSRARPAGPDRLSTGAPIAASTASASALASKASTVRAGPAQLRGTAMLLAQAGRDGALARSASRPCSAGRPRTAPDRRGRAPRCAPPASIRLGRIEGRMVSSVGGDRVQQAQVRAGRRRTARPACAAGTTRSRPRSCRARRAPGAPAARGAARRRAPAWTSPRARGSDVVGMWSKPQHARHFLDQIGLADDVGAPRRHGGRPRAAAARRAKPSLPRMRGGLAGRHVDRRQRLHAVGAQREAALPVRHRRRCEAISLASPPHSSRIRRVATSAPHRHDCGSMPRSKR